MFLKLKKKKKTLQNKKKLKQQMTPPSREAICILVSSSFWKRKWQPTPVFSPGEFHGQRSLAGYGPWDHKQSDMTEQLTHPHLGNLSSQALVFFNKNGTVLYILLYLRVY